MNNVIKPYTLLSRDNLYVRMIYDPTTTNNLNPDKLTVLDTGSQYESENGEIFGNQGFKLGTINPDVFEDYYVLKGELWARSNMFFDIPIDKSLFEIVYNYEVIGPGKFKFIVDGVTLDTVFGDSPMRTSLAHKFFWNSNITLDYCCSVDNYDPTPYACLDNICCYSYSEIECDISNYNPARTSSAPKEIQILRGYKTYQQIQSLSTYFEFECLFYTEEAHTNFVINASNVFVFCDEKGCLYRGVIELGDCRSFSNSTYYQKIKFLSSDKLGVGWL